MKHIAMIAVAALIATVGFRVGEAHESKQAVVRAKNNRVVIKHKTPASYLLVSRWGDDILDVKMAFGQKAVADIQSAGVPNSGITIDVYQVDAMGSLEGPRFRPCTPEPDQSGEPDCTPTRGFPPIVPPRFRTLNSYFE